MESRKGFRYQVGGSLPRDFPAYVERKADDELYNFLSQDEFCFVINSRQMGKSSLRVRVMRRLEEEGRLCALIDPQTLGKTLSADQWYAGIIRRLLSQFNLETNFAFQDWWDERSQLSPEDRFNEFIDKILLPQTDASLVIFIEEIDTLLTYAFDTDGFFSLIRSFHERRADAAFYKRLTFAFFGVTTPNDLIRGDDNYLIDFGHMIELSGFTEIEAQPLLFGLTGKVSDPRDTLSTVLKWSGGQPFLTQKLLALLCDHIQGDKSTECWVAEIVQTVIIDNWENQDEPPHLRTIRDRLRACLEQDRTCVYDMCVELLKGSSVSQDRISFSFPLRLTGFVYTEDGSLKLASLIYSEIFNLDWFNQLMEDLRPQRYAKALKSWREAPKDSSDAYLLKGEALDEAIKWSKTKNPNSMDLRFLGESREAELRSQIQLIIVSIFLGLILVILALYSFDSMGDRAIQKLNSRNDTLNSQNQALAGQNTALDLELKQERATYSRELLKCESNIERHKKYFSDFARSENIELNKLSQEISQIKATFMQQLSNDMGSFENNVKHIMQEIDELRSELNGKDFGDLR
jgi:hypothetical protein